MVEKPTTTSREEFFFDFKDIPEVVICLEPSIDTEVVENMATTELQHTTRALLMANLLGGMEMEQSHPVRFWKRHSE